MKHAFLEPVVKLVNCYQALAPDIPMKRFAQRVQQAFEELDEQDCETMDARERLLTILIQNGDTNSTTLWDVCNTLLPKGAQK